MIPSHPAPLEHVHLGSNAAEITCLSHGAVGHGDSVGDMAGPAIGDDVGAHACVLVGLDQSRKLLRIRGQNGIIVGGNGHGGVGNHAVPTRKGIHQHGGAGDISPFPQEGIVAQRIKARLQLIGGDQEPGLAIISRCILTVDVTVDCARNRYPVGRLCSLSRRCRQENRC